MATEYGAATIWLVIVAAGVGTFALRLSFIALLGRVGEVPPRLVGVLRFVPAAVLAALVAPAVVALGPDLAVRAEPAKVVAGLAAAGVAWRTENVLATISVGLVVLWLSQAML